jgi:hypothetical protein
MHDAIELPGVLKAFEHGIAAPGRSTAVEF